MKIALCLSGCFRGYDTYLHQYIRDTWMTTYDCDIFAHTWNYQDIHRSGMVGPPVPYNVNEMLTQFGFCDAEIDVWEEYHQQFIADSRDVHLLYELQHGTNHHPVIEYSHPYLAARMYSMLYSRWRVKEILNVHMRQQRTQYDMVVLSRFDQTLEIPHLLDWPIDRLTIACHEEDYVVNGEHSMPDDRWAVGPTDLMMEYMSIYPRLRKTKLYGFRHHTGITGPQETIRTYLTYMNLPYRVIPTTKMLGESLPVCMDTPEGCEVTSTRTGAFYESDQLRPITYTV